MCPIDPTPHGGEVFHQPEKQFPEPTKDETHHPGEQHAKEQAKDGEADALRDRPPIPTHSELMGVDVEDEEDDPVVESGPDV